MSEYSLKPGLVASETAKRRGPKTPPARVVAPRKTAAATRERRIRERGVVGLGFMPSIGYGPPGEKLARIGPRPFCRRFRGFTGRPLDFPRSRDEHRFGGSRRYGQSRHARADADPGARAPSLRPEEAAGGGQAGRQGSRRVPPRLERPEEDDRGRNGQSDARGAEAGADRPARRERGGRDAFHGDAEARRADAFVTAGDPEDDLPRMSFLEHLEELRRRLVVSCIAVAVG